ncbi:MAG: hypothetical protein HYY08_00520 [Firmicutes bacterium]|nr:hypothetical protein [Bacillota bacterium]
MPPLAKLFDPGYLFDPSPAGPPSGWYEVLAIAFIVISLAVQGLYYYWARRSFAQDVYHLRLARTVAMFVGAVSSVALILILARYLSLPFLSMRILLILTIVVGLVLAAYFVYYMVRVYPLKTAMAAREAIRQRYLPQQRPRPTPTASRQRRKGKRKKK